MATAEETSCEGGVGGKFRKQSNRSDSKPYNRPPSWISKRVVDPASRIITQSAHKLFSLVFRETLPALTPTSVKHESNDAFPDQNQSIPSGDQEIAVEEGGKVNSKSDSGAINDLEQILKHKTFTRAEIDHLTELLQSKASDVSAEDENRKFETSTSQPVEAPDKVEHIPVQEDKVKSHALFGTPSVSLGRSSFLDEDVASPTELAKAYMGSRLKGTPSTSNLHGQSFRQDVSRQTGLPFTPNSRALTVVQRMSDPYGCATRGPESGHLTPVPRGRSAIHSMACTPYSRVHHTAMLKVDGPMTKEKAGLLASSQRSWRNNLLLSGGKQAAKRRSSVLDSDIGSIGPIRRTRRKTNMMSTPSSSLATRFTPVGSDTATGPIQSTQNQFQLQGPKHNNSVQGLVENGGSSPASRRLVCVSDQSRETAQKILQQLEKIAPSPKGKSRETMEISPFQSVPGVLDGRGIKSTEDVHSSKLMQNSQVNGILDGLGDNSVISTHLRSQKHAMFDEGGPSMIFTSGDKLGPKADETVMRSTKDAMSSLRTATTVMSSTVANVPEMKPDSAKEANKDSAEHEDRNFSSIFGTNRLVPGKGKHDRPDEPFGFPSCLKTPGSFMLKNSNGNGSFDSYPASEKNPVVRATTATAVPDPSSSSPSLNKISTSNKPKSVRFSFASKTVDKAAPSGSSGLNGAQSESKEAKLETESSNRELCMSSNDQNVSTTKLAPTQPEISYFGPSTNSSTTNGLPAFSPSNGLFSNTRSTTAITSMTSISTTSRSQFGPNTSVSTVSANLVSLPPGTSGIKSTDPELNNHSLISSAAFTGASSSTHLSGASASSFVNIQFQSSSTSDSSGLISSTPAAPGTGSNPFSQSGTMQFASSAASQKFGLSESGFGSIMSSTSNLPSLFGSSSQSATSSIVSQTDSKFSTAAFKFGSASATPTTTSPSASSFGSFPFTSVATTSAPPSSFSGSASTGNDQMNTENSMNEHTVLASTPIQSFSQPPNPPQPFSAPSSSGGSSMFQFSSQQDPTTSQNPSLSFRMGAEGGDKSNRRFVKARRDKLRKR